MAEKISIKIDLSRSKRVEHHDDKETHEKLLQQNNKNLVEYKYRYDRIFVLLVFVFIILFSIYLIFSDDQDESMTYTSDNESIKQRHLSVPENVTMKSENQKIYLFYETINVLETFNFPVEEQADRGHNISRF